MKNHWVMKSVAKKFDRISRLVISQWLGLTTRVMLNANWVPNKLGGDSPRKVNRMIVCLEDLRLKVNGSVPPAFKSALKKANNFYVSDSDLVFIYLDGLNGWIKYRNPDDSVLGYYWKVRNLPRFEDPAFMLQIETVIADAVERWKEKEKKKEEKEKKCEEPSSL